MLFSKRCCALGSSLLLCLVAGQAIAADRPAKLDSRQCATPEFPLRWQNDGESGSVIVA